ncbi:COBRA, plant [Dillenia turbinata]|uniref:COBRA, plant n=1 Tax=Dillenia turbinata TaxID=194707 RepID=A0AAN8VQV3_9MAGN
MGVPCNVGTLGAVVFFILSHFHACIGQDYEGEKPAPPPPEIDACDGIFLQYVFIEREKIYPIVKNATAQAWKFKSMATILNAGKYELKAWKMFIEFQNREILVSASGAVVIGGDSFPVNVENGTTIAGYPMADLKTAIDTAGDLSQMQVEVEMTGTMFGLRPPAVPMPKTIRLENDGYKCPKTTHKGSRMYVCCVRDPKYKAKPLKTKFLPRQDGDLSFTYDVLQAFEGNYLAQVTIDNNHPLGRLDHWNLTWEWMRGEFIYNMRGAYTHKKDSTGCIYGPAGQYYKALDFAPVMNCDKRPFISDLPPDKKDDEKVGKLPFCCRNGTLLPKIMDENKARSIFQLQVYKLPPDINRTALSPPQNWNVDGHINPQYKCGAPIRVDPTEFPDPSGLSATISAVASWQVVCNITRPKDRKPRCCVSYSAYYNESVIPCNTCACGCDDTSNCNPNARAMLLSPETLLVPFENRTSKALKWASMKHFPVTKPLPCPDNCGVSLNWHIHSDYRSGWTARITLFNWDDTPFDDWFTAIQIKKAYAGYENVYSFNGTKLPEMNNTIFLQGLPGLNYLMGEVNGTNPQDPRVPGKQQSVISFTKKKTPHINIPKGDGFPTKVFFNGEECVLPTQFPTATGNKSRISLLPLIFLTIMTYLAMADLLH